ncbi:MAG: response regulator, partial [Pseudomonadota bacterium]
GLHGGDCLLIDYKMPRIDGIELMQRIRSNNDQTPGIMITGYYSDSLQRRALRAGFSDVLEKPLAPKSLQAMILNVVG